MFTGARFACLTRCGSNSGVTFTSVNAWNLDEISKAMRPETKLLWLESPSNPLLRCTDLAKAAEIGHAGGAHVVVDNTFATPMLQQPLALGADIVLHSVTKYLGGHSDVIGGAIIVNDEELHEKLRFLQNAAGGVSGPMDCFLVLRGTKTLAVRMKQHCENARRIAEHLAEHPEVEKVYYPGLANDPSHAVASKQMSDFGGMVSLELRGDLERNRRLCIKYETVCPGGKSWRSRVDDQSPGQHDPRLDSKSRTGKGRFA